MVLDDDYDGLVMTNKLKTIAVIGMILLSFSLLFFTSLVKADPDVEYHWTSENNDNETDEYKVVADDSSSEWEVDIQEWKGNKTIIIEFSNIKSVELYLENTDANPEDYKGWLDVFGSTITMKLRSTDVHEMDFLITGIPEFDDVNLNDGQWDDYNYDADNNEMDFSLTFSENVITFDYSGYFGGLAMAVFMIFWVLLTIRFVVDSFNFIIKQV